jgi:hypothetical protein
MSYGNDLNEASIAIHLSNNGSIIRSCTKTRSSNHVFDCVYDFIIMRFCQLLKNLLIKRTKHRVIFT